MKISIILPDNFITLGIGGVNSFFKAFSKKDGDTMDAVQVVDESFLENFQSMETQKFGFTEDFKAKCMLLFNQIKGKKVLLSEKWIINRKDSNYQELSRVVEHLNSPQESLFAPDFLTEIKV